MNIIEYLNNREIAISLWIGVTVIFLLLAKPMRDFLKTTLKLIFTPKMVIALALNASYLAGIFYLFSRLELLHGEALKDGILWLLTASPVMFFGVNKALEDHAHFKKIIFQLFKIEALLIFIVNTHTFSLTIELILVPVLVIIGACQALIEVKPEFSEAKKVFDGILVILGLAMIYLTFSHAISDPETIFSVETVIAFLVPILLTIFYIPFLYFFAAIMAYELMSIRIPRFISENTKKPKSPKFTTWIKIFSRCGFDTVKIKSLEETIISSIRSEKDLIKFLTKNLKG